MAEIAPDRKKRNRQGNKSRFKEILNPFDCHGGERMHPRHNRRNEPLKHAGTSQIETRGHFSSVHADAEQGTPSAAAEGESIEVEEEPNGHGFE